MGHVPVLAGPAMEYLRIRRDGVYVDCTAGAGGHSALIAEQLSSRGTLIAIDRDPVAMRMARERLSGFPCARVVQGNYGDLTALLREERIEHVDGVLIDAGVSSMQLDEAGRGFSFQEEGPLDMRMDSDSGPTAAEFLMNVSEPELLRVLCEYGDVNQAKRVAAHLCKRRETQPFENTRDLADAVAEVFDFVQGMPEETRTVFQAIRIAVNDELRYLHDGIEQAIDALAPKGRIVCITFHSGEDRIAKNLLRAASRDRQELHPDGRVKETHKATLKLLTRKPVEPSEEEAQSNPRSRSARLRAAEKVLAA